MNGDGGSSGAELTGSGGERGCDGGGGRVKAGTQQLYTQPRAPKAHASMSVLRPRRQHAPAAPQKEGHSPAPPHADQHRLPSLSTPGGVGNAGRGQDGCDGGRGDDGPEGSCGARGDALGDGGIVGGRGDGMAGGMLGQRKRSDDAQLPFGLRTQSLTPPGMVLTIV